MNHCYLKFYVSEKVRHGHLLAYDWLLAEGQALGLEGGSAFRALAGYGRHGRRHEDHFFELAGDLPVEVGFVTSWEEADRFIARVAAAGLDLFYLRVPVEAGFTGTQGGAREPTAKVLDS